MVLTRTLLVALACVPHLSQGHTPPESPAAALAKVLRGHFQSLPLSPLDTAAERTHVQAEMFQNPYLSAHFGGGSFLLVREFNPDESTAPRKVRIYHLQGSGQDKVLLRTLVIRDVKVKALAEEGRTSAVDSLMGVPPPTPSLSQEFALVIWQKQFDEKVRAFIQENTTNTPQTTMILNSKKHNYIRDIYDYLKKLPSRELRLEKLLQFKNTLINANRSFLDSSDPILTNKDDDTLKPFEDFLDTCDFSLPNYSRDFKHLMKVLAPTFEQAFNAIKEKGDEHQQVQALIALENSSDIFRDENLEEFRAVYESYKKIRDQIFEKPEADQLPTFISLLTSPNDPMDPNDPFSETYFQKYLAQAAKGSGSKTEEPILGDSETTNVVDPALARSVAEQLATDPACDMLFTVSGGSWQGETVGHGCYGSRWKMPVAHHQKMTLTNTSITVEDTYSSPTSTGPSQTPTETVITELERVGVYDCWVDRALGMEDTQKGIIFPLTGGSQILRKWDNPSRVLEMTLAPGPTSLVTLREIFLPTGASNTLLEKEIISPVRLSQGSPSPRQSVKSAIPILGMDPNLVSTLMARGIHIPQAPGSYPNSIGFWGEGYQGSCRYID